MQQTPPAIRSLRILYFALLAGMLLMSGVIFLVSNASAPIVENTEAAKNFFLLVLMIAAVCVSISSALMSIKVQIKFYLGVTPKGYLQRAGLYAGWELVFRLPTANR